MVKKIGPLLLVLMILSERSSFAQAPLIPRPVSYQQQQGQFLLNAATRILAPAAAGSPDLLAQTLRDFTGLPLAATHTAGENEIQWAIDPSQAPQAEGYTLVAGPGHIHITGHDSAGVFYGIQSLIQLLQPQPEAGLQDTHQPKPGFTVAACSITDYPRFHYRGMHLDVSRHFFQVSAIKKWINVLALYKFNTFHWHLTDDQGWRIEIKKYPLLQSVAAWRQETLIGHKKEMLHRFDGKRYGGYYTQEEVKEIVQYAADRQITVIPEIEMPGHAQAALAAYPGLGCTDGPYQTGTYWGIFDDVYCAGNDSVFVFLQNVLDEVMTLFPSRSIHIGGDECPQTRWAACPKCQKTLKDLGLKDGHALQSYFVQRIEKYINSKGRNIIGWDEILEGGLAPGATVMSWRGEEGGLAAAQQRHPVIMAPESHLYFDYYQSLYPQEQLAAGSYTPLSKVYGYEPLAAHPDKEVLQYISGIEGTLWTEYLPTVSKLEYMLFPRSIALAELGWSPFAGRDYPDFLQRLRSQKRLLQHLTINYAGNFDEINYSSRPLPEKGKIEVSLSGSLPDADVRYTTDNSTPDLQSPLYTGPFTIQWTCTVKAMLFHRQKPQGRLFRQSFQLHKAVGARVTLAHPSLGRYAQANERLVNGLAGTDRYNDGQWLSITRTDLEPRTSLASVRYIL